MKLKVLVYIFIIFIVNVYMNTAFNTKSVIFALLFFIGIKIRILFFDEFLPPMSKLCDSKKFNFVCVGPRELSSTYS